MIRIDVKLPWKCASAYIAPCDSILEYRISLFRCDGFSVFECFGSSTVPVACSDRSSVTRGIVRSTVHNTIRVNRVSDIAEFVDNVTRGFLEILEHFGS